MHPIKIALGDLRHRTEGKHSVFMPIGIGYIASYTLAQLGSNNFEIRLYDDPYTIFRDIDVWKPEIVGLSNYSWNSELSRLVFRYAKKKLPEVVCIAGGPEFPVNDYTESKNYLSKSPEIDFYVYCEGEIPFCRLIKKLKEGIDIYDLKNNPQDGIMSIHPETGDLVFGKPPSRLIDLDEIPSPYLNGLLDSWFNGHYSPAIETSRGCPFSCGYCFIGQPWFNNVSTFSIQRVKDELTYIAQRIKENPSALLLICDSNFGMYERDEEIAIHIRSLQDNFGWPNAFELTTGKANYDRILKIAAILNNKMHVTCSVQTLYQKTLEVIKRKNPSLDEYQRINVEMKKHGMHSVTELIVPMPEETKNSFFDGLKLVINKIGVNRIVPYTTILLKGTYLSSKECREKYQLQTKFRILPRQFGEYLGEKCFEVEEACIATNTMPLDDYLQIRGFSLISAFFSGEQFDLIHRHLKELGISAYDYLYSLWELIKSGETALSEIYNQFIEDTKGELWDSREVIYEYFNKPANYAKLVSGEFGDNLIRKYQTKLLLEMCIPSIELGYSCIERFGYNVMTKEIQGSLDAAEKWMVALRNVSAVFEGEPHINISEILQLPYDVNSWYLNNSNCSPLITYNKPMVYRIFCDADRLKRIFAEAKKLYGGDLYFQVAKLLIYWSIKNFWRQCEPLKRN